MKTQLNTLTPEECDKLLEHLQFPPGSSQPTRVGHRNYTMALLMLDAGLRVGELVQLKQDQLIYGSAPVGELTVLKDQAKNKHERSIPISPRLHDAIARMWGLCWRHPTVHKEHLAFYTRNGRHSLTVRCIQKIIKSAGATSINRDIHPHLLRHTFATRLMTKTSMRVVQELLGHTNLGSTQIYTHPNSEDRKKAIDSLNKNE